MPDDGIGRVHRDRLAIAVCCLCRAETRFFDRSPMASEGPPLHSLHYSKKASPAGLTSISKLHALGSCWIRLQ
jgi:hypothetical protein